MLLPVTLTTGLSPQQLEVILIHELSHLRRYDHLVLMLQRLVEAVLFFHPAIWYVSRCLSVERENCCDDAVIASGAPRVAYAELLLKLAERFLNGFFLAQCCKTLGRLGADIPCQDRGFVFPAHAGPIPALAVQCCQ